MLFRILRWLVPHPQLKPVGLIIRQKDPNNLETPFDELGAFITQRRIRYEVLGGWCRKMDLESDKVQSY